MLGWVDAATGVPGGRDVICGFHELCTEQWCREWKGVGSWKVVWLSGQGSHHTQIDVAPLLDDVGSFRVPDRCPSDRAPSLRAALRSLRGFSDAPSPPPRDLTQNGVSE